MERHKVLLHLNISDFCLFQQKSLRKCPNLEKNLTQIFPLTPFKKGDP